MVELETWITWGLTALAAAIGIVTIWLWWRQRKPEEPALEPKPVPRLELARAALEQRKKEHQWQQAMDVADRVLPIILSDDEDDEE